MYGWIAFSCFCFSFQCIYICFSDNDFLNEDQSVLVSHGGSPVLLFAAMRIANWRKLWGSANWETVENCWELWKLVRIVGTCRVGWIKKRKQWFIYFQPLRVHTGRFFVFIILWQPLFFSATPLNIDIHESLFVCWGATWCVGDFGNQRNLCLIFSYPGGPDHMNTHTHRHP